MKARRFETIADTSLRKVLKSTCCANARMLQIDLQRWFRAGIRHLRENAPAESPCNYGYPERMVNEILCLVGDGSPLWHDHQLHLAEWQAFQLIG